MWVSPWRCVVVIPDRLREYDLLKIHGPTADCDHPGKQPVGSATSGPFYHASDPELRSHVEDGGNVGLPLTGPLVVFDVDHERFGELLDDQLPPTFRVRTGSGGDHRYYHAPEWTDNRQISDNGTDYGSVRSDAWQVVIPPSVHPETGEEYEVLEDRPIRSIGTEAIESVLETALGQDGDKSANTAAPAGCAGGSSSGLPSIPITYPNRPAEWATARSWLDSNGFLGDLKLSAGDRSAREFKLAKCLAEGGFSETVISDALDRLPHDSKWHERGDDYQDQTVRNAILAACEDPYVEFDTPADMDGSTSERRKTESGGPNPGTHGGETNMPDFTDKEEVLIQEASDPGDDFKKIVRVEGTDDDGETFHYLALKEGFKREGETDDGQTVTFEQVTDSKSLGSPDYVEDLIDGLDEMKAKLNGQSND